MRARFNAVDLQRAPHWFRIGACVLVIALVTGIIYGLDVVAPTVSLVALYLFAVVPIAVVWGLTYAVPASIASMLTFNFLFLPPLYTFTLADTENWVALAIFLVTGIVVGDLAARVRRRAAEAEQREREEALLAEVATSFLQGTPVTEELDGLAERLRQILRAEHARVELGPQRDPPAGESPHELRAGTRRVGTLYLREGADPNLAIRRRFLPALASLLAVAIDRERLTGEALEAEALRKSDTVKTAVLQRRQPRPPVTADGDPRGLRDPSQRTAHVERRRPGRDARDDRDESQAGSSAWCATSSISRGSRRERRSRWRSSGRSTSSSPRRSTSSGPLGARHGLAAG